MKRYFFTILAVVAMVMGANGATVSNEYFSLTTLDDSWFLTNDDALRPYGARVDVSRVDARGATLELARVDYIEGAFDPLLYLTRQVIEKKDVFCRSASGFSEIYESYVAGHECQAVGFKKRSNNYDYDCEAMAYNVGFGTFFIITAHRANNPTMVGRLVDGIQYNIETKALTTTSEYVAAASKVVARHHLPIGNNEHLSGVEMSGDSSTVTLKVTVPYITRESVNVPAFVTTKRDAWFKQATEALKFNLLLATAKRERKQLRYFYVDTKGEEIGTLLIMPEEYEYAEQLEAERIQREAERKLQEKLLAEQEAERAKQEAERAKQEAERAKQEAERAKQEAARAEQEAKQRAIEEARKAPFTHVVQSGENLTKIAKKYGVTISSIKKMNPNINVDQLKIGQKLTIKR